MTAPEDLAPEPLLRFGFDPPDEVWSINKRVHWARRAELVRNWRKAGAVYARQAKGAWAASPAVVTVRLPFRDRRRRDPHNYVGTVVKAIVDGLVDAGLFPDDTPEWVTVAEPVIRCGATEVTVSVAPRGG